MGIAGIAQKQLLHKMKWVQIQKRYQPWFDTLAHHGTSAIAQSVLKFLHLLVSHGLTPYACLGYSIQFLWYFRKVLSALGGAVQVPWYP